MKRAVLLIVLIAACGRENKRGGAPITITQNGQSESEELRRERLKAELSDDILASYERDEPPDVTDTLRPEIGGGRIGFGPDDVWIADERLHAQSRWRRDPPPANSRERMYIPGDDDTTIRSKHLQITLAADRSAAWVSDELSWRITACGRTAVIPLRSTALYAHDGDRWIPVFEHVSFARSLRVAPDGTLNGRPIKSETLRDVADAISGALARSLSGRGQDPSDATLLGPALDDDWKGADIAKAKIGTGPIRAEDRRVGTVGRSIARATVAYWIGNFDVDTPAGKVRLRGTFVFEKRDGSWVLVQGHLSQPIDDADLAIRVFGTALVSLDPLQLSC